MNRPIIRSGILSEQGCIRARSFLALKTKYIADNRLGGIMFGNPDLTRQAMVLLNGIDETKGILK